jgi:hypothetical protein
LAGENIVNEIKKLRVNAVYGKKTHFNAATRKRRYHHILSLPTIVINIVTGTTLFALMGDLLQDKLWIPAIAAFLSAILSGVSEYFKFGKAAESHDTVATRYLQLIRKSDGAVAKFNDGLIELSQISQIFDELAIELDEINASSATLQPSSVDYKKSREGVNDDEEKYTDKEIKNS